MLKIVLIYYNLIQFSSLNLKEKTIKLHLLELTFVFFWCSRKNISMENEGFSAMLTSRNEYKKIINQKFFTKKKLLYAIVQNLNLNQRFLTWDILNRRINSFVLGG